MVSADIEFPNHVVVRNVRRLLSSLKYTIYAIFTLDTHKSSFN